MILTWLVPQTASQYALFLLQGSLRDGPGRWCQILEQPRHKEQVTCARVQNRGSREEEVRIALRSEEHTSELQSLMRSSYAVFCLKKKKNTQQQIKNATR